MKLIAYSKTNGGWDFPSALEDPAEVKNYISAFYYAWSPLLKEVSDGDEHIMRACSLLAILPPPPGMPVRHLEIPMDLNTMRLPDWVNNVRDLATGLVMLPPHLLSDWKSNPVICPPQVGEGGRSQILQVLPASTHGVQMQPNQCVESYLNQADSGYSDHHSFT